MKQKPASRDNPIVCLDSDLPLRLFNPRRIASTDEIADCFWTKERLPLLTPDPAVISRLLSGGAENDASGTFIRRGAPINFEILNESLPFVAKHIIVPRLGDLIPPTSFGANLCNLLVPSCWEALRQITFSTTGFHCEICGAGKRLECHELWEYHEPLSAYRAKGVCGVQRLLRLMTLCEACHETYHLGLANIRGRAAIAGARVRAYNRWTESEYEEYVDFIDARNARRTDCFWVLDFSVLAPFHLVVHDKWRLEDNGFLGCDTRTGPTVTMILGVSWRHAGVNYPLTSPDVGYYE